jgi:sulfoxide reductase heme-binding subunit YedZ
MLTLCLTPLRELSHQADWLRIRRLLGLFAFFYLSIHVVFYVGVDLRFSAKALWDDVKQYPWILVGALGFVLMLPLALTSFDRMIRALKKRWKQLHRLVYLVVLLGCWHFFWQVKKDKTEPLMYVAIFVLLMILRIPFVVKKWRRII